MIIPFVHKPIENERGMALLITVMVVSLLTAITAHFGLSVRHEITASTHARDRSRLQAVARSGIHWGMAALKKDGEENNSDSVHDKWAKMKNVNFSSLFGRGDLELDIIDLGGRLQLNSLVKSQGGVDDDGAERSRDILKRLLLDTEQFAIEDEEHAQEIVDSLVDWIDDNDKDQEENFGAENTHYLGLQHPYECKNGPVEFVDELLLVQGIDENVLYGTKDKKGLADFVTAHGNDGKININTAPKLLLQVMTTNMTSDLAQKMDDHRINEDKGNSLEALDWYKQVENWNPLVVLDADTVTTKSSYFLINATGNVHNIEKKIAVVAERDSNNEVILLTKKVD